MARPLDSLGVVQALSDAEHVFAAGSSSTATTTSTTQKNESDDAAELASWRSWSRNTIDDFERAVLLLRAHLPPTLVTTPAVENEDTKAKIAALEARCAALEHERDEARRELVECKHSFAEQINQVLSFRRVSTTTINGGDDNGKYATIDMGGSTRKSAVSTGASSVVLRRRKCNTAESSPTLLRRTNSDTSEPSSPLLTRHRQNSGSISADNLSSSAVVVPAVPPKPTFVVTKDRLSKHVQKKKGLAKIRMDEQQAALALQSVYRGRMIRRAYESARRQCKIVAELVETERRYVQHLSTIVDGYYLPLLNAASEANRVLPESEVKSLFQNAPVIQLYHQRLWEDLQKHAQPKISVRSDETPREKRKKVTLVVESIIVISALFQTACRFLLSYSTYINSFSTTTERFESLRSTNPAFAAFVTERERSSGYSFASLAIMPVQRVPRYQLLFSQLVDASSSLPECVAVRDALQKANESLNGRKRDKEMEELKKTLHTRLFGVSSNGGDIEKISQRVFSAHQRMRAYGMLGMRRDGSPRIEKVFMALLTDAVLVCSVSSDYSNNGSGSGNGSGAWTPTNSTSEWSTDRPLPPDGSMKLAFWVDLALCQSVMALADDEVAKVRHAFLLDTGKCSFMFTATTAIERDAWIVQLSKTIATNSTNTKQRVSSSSSSSSSSKRRSRHAEDEPLSLTTITSITPLPEPQDETPVKEESPFAASVRLAADRRASRRNLASASTTTSFAVTPPTSSLSMVGRRLPTVPARTPAPRALVLPTGPRPSLRRTASLNVRTVPPSIAEH
jgi:hypothetical protein